jgi:hypothetical protein
MLEFAQKSMSAHQITSFRSSRRLQNRRRRR